MADPTSGDTGLPEAASRARRRQRTRGSRTGGNRTGDSRALDSREAGRRGEELAQRFLEERGVRILARNVHLRHAEIDLLGLDGDVLCVVEVRLRSGLRFGSAFESVDARKQRRLARATAQLLATRRLPRHRNVRFDVIAVDASQRPARIERLTDAFSLTR